MTAIPIPEPVAFASSDPGRANQLWSRAQYDSMLPRNRTRCDIPLITTTQAEAYASAVRAAALEEAAQACEARFGVSTDPRIDTTDVDVEAGECAAAIRALIPPLPGPVEPTQEAS